MTEPTTAAGRIFLDSLAEGIDFEWGGDSRPGLLPDILAIEAEARAAALDEVAELRRAAELVLYAWDTHGTESALWAVQMELRHAIDALREGGKDVSRGT